MRLRLKYKSCLLTRTDIWGDLIKKKKFFKRKWSTILRIVKSKRRYRRHQYQRVYKDYNFIQTRTRPNTVFKYKKWSLRNSLSARLCLKRFYGDLKEKPFKALCRKLWHQPKPAYALIRTLESRLDTTLYRLAFFSSIPFSAQAINHGKVLVNGVVVTSASYQIKRGDLIEISPKYRSIIKARMMSLFAMRYPRWKVPTNLSWLEVNYPTMSFIVLDNVDPRQVFYPFRVNFDNILWFSKFGS
ncbi:unnamed protein product [Discosporangium mesarthrocarpum]